MPLTGHFPKSDSQINITGRLWRLGEEDWEVTFPKHLRHGDQTYYGNMCFILIAASEITVKVPNFIDKETEPGYELLPALLQILVFLTVSSKNCKGSCAYESTKKDPVRLQSRAEHESKKPHVRYG